MKTVRLLKSLGLLFFILAILSACATGTQPQLRVQSPTSPAGQAATPAPSQAATQLPALPQSETATPGTPLPTPVPAQAANLQAGTATGSGSLPLSKCAASSPSSNKYQITLCFTAPGDGSALSGDAAVTTALTASSGSPGTERVVFYLNGIYLLTDFQSPYTFTLPTENWMDGNYNLSVESLQRDGFVSGRAGITVSFKNGISSLPVNKKSFKPATGTQPAKGQPFVVVATGDGASGEASSQKVTDLIASLNPNLFLYLGDVYESGSMAEFYNWYGNGGAFFDRFRSMTDPTVGNHEYVSSKEAQGYFNYWDNVPNYYSFNAGGWHFISLNANASRVKTDPSSPQYQWLASDLAANASMCTIVFYHQPFFNIGPEGSEAAMSDIWALMAQYGVSIVLNGHDHDYQRWVPLDGKGQPNPSGITEFVAGGGGHGLQTLPKGTDSRVANSNDMKPDAFGALELELNPGGVNFSYINEKNVVLDSGVIACSKAKSDVQPPDSPSGLSTNVAGATHIDLAWQASTDNTGINGYTIYRDGNQLATVSGTTLAYADSTVLPDTTYSYRVDAFDLAGNHSPPSNVVTVTTPSMPSTLTFNVEADTYVSQSSPDSNYGSASTLRLDASPDIHAYLRFVVSGLAGMSIARARLLLYANEDSSQGIQVQSVAEDTWAERMVTYSNAPTLGGVLANSDPFTAGSWVTIDLTPYITGEGSYSFGITTLSSSALTFPARESGTNSAQLVIDLTP